jgi:glycosyltransferase involved in cell wall biosynthesis
VVGFFGSKGSDSDNNRKGIDVFIASLKRAAARIPELKGIIAGPGWGEVVQELKAGGLAISYLGVVSDSQLPVIYSALDVYMVTARIEGGPCTVLESMACGTPVIATRVGLVPEVIADWKNGVSVPVDDVDGMSEALIRYSSSSADSRQHISENARETALKKPWNKVLQPLAGVYEELLRDKKRAPKRTRQPIDKISDLATRVEHLCTIRGKASSSIMHYMPLLQPNELALTWKALRLLKAPSPEF